MERKTKIEISMGLKKFLDWSNVNKTMSYDDLIWGDIDHVYAYLDWSEKHPEYDNEIRNLFLKRRKERLASSNKIYKHKREPKKLSKVRRLEELKLNTADKASI